MEYDPSRPDPDRAGDVSDQALHKSLMRCSRGTPVILLLKGGDQLEGTLGGHDARGIELDELRGCPAVPRNRPLSILDLRSVCCVSVRPLATVQLVAPPPWRRYPRPIATSLEDALSTHPPGTPLLLLMKDGREIEARIVDEGTAGNRLQFEDATQPAVDLDQIVDVLIGEDSEGIE